MICSTCPGCSLTLKEPYVRCTECEPIVDFCLQCFAKGREFLNHVNYHCYEMRSLMFSLFDTKWTSREELELLQSIEECGFGNWSEISKRVQSKTKEDCEQHYIHHYMEKPIPTLPKFKVNKEKCWRRPAVYKASVYPPRPDCNNSDDVLYAIGYMPARGDFIVEYDNFAECDLKDVEFNDDKDDELVTELKHAVSDIYLTRFQERQFKKRLLKDYGLLDCASTHTVKYDYDRDERVLRDRFCKFAQLLKPTEHEKLLQSILNQRQLESRITQLQEYRKSGLRNFKDAFLYEKLKKRRKSMKAKTMKIDEALLHAENPVACRVWLQRQMNGNKSYAGMPSMPHLHRKPSAPLDLTGIPGVELLTADEKQLCSSLRLMPESYTAYRKALQKESFLSNGIKLKTARDLLKIDVNKTSRLYEFCLNQGFIKNSLI